MPKASSSRRISPPPEKTTGDHTFQWDGKSSVGPLKDLFIHPLWSPYTVTLKSGGLSDKAEFKVLYHSVELARGPWTHDENNWVAYKLNELGFYGGPHYHDRDNYLDKAIVRYKADHKAIHLKYVKDYKTTITPALKTALAAGDKKRVDVWIEAPTYERTAGTGTELKDKTNHVTTEAARLNRPLLPLEVEIFLESKSDAKTVSPEAIGPVRVNWKHTDIDEDLTELPED